MNRKLGLFLVWGAAMSLGLSGCSERRKKEKKINHVDGIVRKIDLKNNVVSMAVVDKEGREREMPGSIREDTEVSINGRASRLEDVREGDNVSAFFYREGKEDDLKFIATKVEVKRSSETDWKSTGAKPAASQGSAAPLKKP